MEFGAELVGILNTNTRGFCKETIEKLTKDWPGGSYLVLMSRPMVPWGRLRIAIGYKYNAREFLSFIVTDNAGRTNVGLPYLSKYPEQFTNVAIKSVSLPLVMSKFFGAVNEVDSHNKSRHYDLEMEKLWVTQCVWLPLCTTFSMGMTITNFWKLFLYGVKRDHYDKLIGIREFPEPFALDCFNNHF